MYFLNLNILIILLAYHIVEFECNVCQKDSSTNDCTSSNSKYILTKFNDFILDTSFLLSFFDSNNNLKCLSTCSTNLQCVFSVFKQNKCFVCNQKIIRFLSFNSIGNSKIYQKRDSKFILID